MAKTETKRRFLTLELNPDWTDQEEARFKEWIADGLNDLRFASNEAVLIIPKLSLRTKFKNDSNIAIVTNKILTPK